MNIFNREPKERTKTFTRHTSRIEYIDGTEEEIVWDEKRVTVAGLIAFYKYDGVYTSYDTAYFDEELLFSVSPTSIKKFETIDKEKMEFTYTK